jgi:hypothetical protein
MFTSNIAIISFDPGITTGVVIAERVDFSTRSFDLTYAGELLWSNRSNIYYALQQLKTEEEEGKLYLAAIIIEEYRLYPYKAESQGWSNMPVPRLIERITVYAELLNWGDRIRMQGANLRLNCTIPPKHKILLKSKHITDAYKHLCYFIAMQKNRSKRKR